MAKTYKIVNGSQAELPETILQDSVLRAVEDVLNTYFEPDDYVIEMDDELVSASVFTPTETKLFTVLQAAIPETTGVE